MWGGHGAAMAPKPLNCNDFSSLSSPGLTCVLCNVRFEKREAQVSDVLVVDLSYYTCLLITASTLYYFHNMYLLHERTHARARTHGVHE